VVCVGVLFARGQNSQLIFDPNGNLQSQRAEGLALPKIIGQPQIQIAAPGASASFSVVVADTRGLSYQWRSNGSDLLGQTNDTLLLTNVSAANEGVYSVFISNGSGSVVSDPAFLFIDSNGNGLPDSWEVAHFGSLRQTATGDFDGDGVSNLQEFLDGTDPSDSASALYHLALVNDGGTVVVVPDQPAYTNGATVTLTAIASGGAPFHAWTGDVLSRSNSITVTMNTNKAVFAYFGPVPFLWTNAAGGDWNSASNWSPNLVPGTNDRVLIPLSATVTLNGNADCEDVTLGASGNTPTLTGSGTLTVRGSLLWSSGNFDGTGRTVVETGGVCVIDLSVAGAIHSRTLELGGTTFWTGSGHLTLDDAVITNRPGALFDVQSTGAFNLTGSGAGRFDNAGILHKAVAGTTAFNFVSFNNYNLAQVQSGTLLLAGGGTNSGSLSLDAGTTLNVASGTFTSSPGSSVVGGGRFDFSGGTANFAGDWLGTNNTFTFSGGTANFDGTGTVAPSVVNLDSGALGGAQTVTVGEVMNWTGGAMNGTGRTVIPPGVTLNAAISSFATMASRTLENSGTTIWTGLGNIILNDAVITNRPGALFDVQNASSINFGGGTPRLDNAGTFRKSGAGLTSFNGVSFHNYNDVEIQTGTLSLLGGGLNHSVIIVPASTALELGGGFNSSAGSSISGAGQFTASFGTVTLAGLVNVTGSNFFANGTANLTGNYFCTNNTLTISGATANFDGLGTVAPTVLNLNGTLGGAQTVTVGAVMNWTGGAMNGTGRTIISPGATLNASMPSTVSLAARTLENGGTTVWTGLGILLLSGVVTNRPGALFDIQSPSMINFGGDTPRFDNAGTFRKSTTSGTFIVTSGVNFSNYGKVEIRGGVLEANGGYFSSSNALLNCAIGGTLAGTNYGQLQVAGTVNLNGALSISLTNGFLPTTNNSFTVLTAGSRNGTFATFDYPSNSVTMQLSNTPNSVVVLVAEAAPALFGAVAYYPANGAGAPLSDVRVANVSLNLGGDTNLAALNSFDGSYSFTKLPPGGTYSVTPSLQNDSSTANGVTTLDIALIRRHVLGLAPLGSPYKLLAADANGSGTVTTLDIALIRKLILGLTNSLPAGLWRFVPADYVFPDPQNPWTAPTNRSYTNLTSGLTGQDFLAVKLGDVNNSWTAPPAPNAVIRPSARGVNDGAGEEDQNSIRFYTSNQVVHPGETVQVKVDVAGFDAVTTAQFTLEWDPKVLRYVGTSNFGLRGLGEDNFGSQLADSGKLTFSWDDPQGIGATVAEGSTLFMVAFAAIGPVGSGSVVALVDDPTLREATIGFKVARFEGSSGEIKIELENRVLLSGVNFAPGEVRVSVPTEAGVRYVLEFRDSLSEGAWRDSAAVVGDGTIKELTDLEATTRQRFYRVRVE
jgi:hypothetical protein